MESLPSMSQLSDLYKDLSLNLEKQCTQKLIESKDEIKFFESSSQNSTCTGHTQTFAGAFRKKFSTTEMSLKGVNLKQINSI